MVLCDYDEVKESTFEPSDVEEKVSNFPKVGITCFSRKLMDRFVNAFNAQEIAVIRNANERVPVYKITYKNVSFALFMSRVGAPACTVSYEEVMAMGLDKLIMFGTCGVLDKKIEDLAIIIPNAAIRDEGTSYHYLPASDEIVINQKYKNDFINILKENNISYHEGKVWTTDAPYRETKNKVLKRKEQGCICVDMEASAMHAVAKFRGKDLFQFFYAADNLDNVKWDKRSLGNLDRLDDKEKIIYLALELALKML